MIAGRLRGELDDVHIISSDRFRGRVYDRILREVDAMLGKHEVLVVDATFYRKKWRERLRELASGRDRVVTVFVDCSLETCLRRNLERKDPIPDAAIHVIWNEFERPEDPEFYIDTEKLGVEEAVDKILRKIGYYPAQN